MYIYRNHDNILSLYFFNKYLLTTFIFLKMKKNWPVLISRILLGIALITFGSNNFLHFMPMPPMSEDAQGFMAALAKAGYFFPIIGIVNILVGISLLTNKFVPLMLLVLVPITLNGILFHVKMDMPGLPMAAVIGLIHAFLIYNYSDKYMPLV